MPAANWGQFYWCFLRGFAALLGIVSREVTPLSAVFWRFVRKAIDARRKVMAPWRPQVGEKEAAVPCKKYCRILEDAHRGLLAGADGFRHPPREGRPLISFEKQQGGLLG
jgi:hypothetical protein